jgi:HAAS
MPDREHPIDLYLSHLARRLHLRAAERDQLLAEVRRHLEERARALHETGVSEEQAERQAVQAFGPLRRISRELQASHPIAWGKRHWTVGMVTGAGVTWALWLVGTVPVMLYQSYALVLSGAPIIMPPLPMVLWESLRNSLLSLPLVFRAIYFLGWRGWLWVLSFLILYLVLPFRWGSRAQHWWAPGLAYGLGIWLLAVLEFVLTVRLMAERAADSAMARAFMWASIPYLGISYVEMSALAFSLALVASFVGWWWRERSVSALARAQAA